MLNDEDILDIVKETEQGGQRERCAGIHVAARPTYQEPQRKPQRNLIDAYEKNDTAFAVGPAGTGKTYQHRPCRKGPQGESHQENHPLTTSR